VTVTIPEAAVSTPQRNRQPASGSRKRSSFGLLVVLPYLLFMLVFAAYPLAQVVRMAFSKVQFQSGEFRWEFGTLRNLAQLLDDPLAARSAMNTVVFIAATVPLSLVAGVLLAVLVDRSALFAPLARNLALWPAIVAPVVVSLIWLLVLSPSIGALNKGLESLGLPAQGWLGSETGAMAAIILVDVWHWTPVVFLLVYTALRAIDRELLEAARMDGASEAQTFWRVILPLLTPALAAAALIRLVMGVKAFDEMYLLTRGGPGDATTLVSLHIRNVFFDRLELGYGAGLSLVVVVAVAAVVAVFFSTRRLASRGSTP
jgi:multiple sugar transport system permease protein